MSDKTLPVTFRNYGMIEFAINLNTKEELTNGILDAVSYIYWLFDDESGMEFSIHIRYKQDENWSIKAFEGFNWKTKLKGLEKYLGRVRSVAFNRAERKNVSELILELRVLDSRFFHCLGTVQEMVSATADLMENESDNYCELMKAHYPQRYQELLMDSVEYNR